MKDLNARLKREQQGLLRPQAAARASMLFPSGPLGHRA